MKKYTTKTIFIIVIILTSCEKKWERLQSDRFYAVASSNPGNQPPVPYRRLGSDPSKVDGDASNPKGFSINEGDTFTITRYKSALAKAKRFKDEITGMGKTPF